MKTTLTDRAVKTAKKDISDAVGADHCPKLGVNGLNADMPLQPSLTRLGYRPRSPTPNGL
jgi:hypothetical protein